MNSNFSRDTSAFEATSGFGRRFRRRFWATVLLAAAAVLVGSSVVAVDETEYVVVERLGRIVAVYDRSDDRGLHVKCPWPIDTVRRFDRRVQLFDPPGREIFTSDKKNITVDAYVCWKIAEPNAIAASLSDRPVVRFFRSLGDPAVAEARLDSRLRSILSTHVGQVELASLLNVADSERGPDDDRTGPLETIAAEVRRQVTRRAAETQSLEDRWGIQIVDLRIKRINLPLGNQQAVFERMRSERKKIADRYRSSGMAENMVIKSQADRQYNEILARARADAERIRGQAEADAINILNRAHAQDPEFYRVTRTLDTYRKILNEKTTLILSASSSLLKLLTEGIPDAVPAPLPEKTSPSEPAADATREKVSQSSRSEDTTAATRQTPAVASGVQVGGTPGATSATGRGFPAVQRRPPGHSADTASGDLP